MTKKTVRRVEEAAVMKEKEKDSVALRGSWSALNWTSRMSYDTSSELLELV